jgi:formylglycine-generating enzyme required for sulfatase activity
MGGNISEWCHDYYSANISTRRQHSDPLGPVSGLHRVVRGSSWRDATVKELRLSYRAYQKSPKDTIGFRIARYQ